MKQFFRDFGILYLGVSLVFFILGLTEGAYPKTISECSGNPYPILPAFKLGCIVTKTFTSLL